MIYRTNPRDWKAPDPSIAATGGGKGRGGRESEARLSLRGEGISSPPLSATSYWLARTIRAAFEAYFPVPGQSRGKHPHKSVAKDTSFNWALEPADFASPRSTPPSALVLPPSAGPPGEHNAPTAPPC